MQSFQQTPGRQVKDSKDLSRASSLFVCRRHDEHKAHIGKLKALCLPAVVQLNLILGAEPDSVPARRWDSSVSCPEPDGMDGTVAASKSTKKAGLQEGMENRLLFRSGRGYPSCRHIHLGVRTRSGTYRTRRDQWSSGQPAGYSSRQRSCCRCQTQDRLRPAR